MLKHILTRPISDSRLIIRSTEECWSAYKLSSIGCLHLFTFDKYKMWHIDILVSFISRIASLNLYTWRVSGSWVSSRLDYECVFLSIE